MTIPLSSSSVVALSDAVRKGRVTSRALSEAALARIAERDPALGAFQVVRGQRALDEADAVDARVDRADLPLAGVPIAVKDNVSVAGEPMRFGTEASDPARQTGIIRWWPGCAQPVLWWLDSPGSRNCACTG